MKKLTIIVIAAALIVGARAFAEDGRKGDIYPLGTCPVTGEKLDPKEPATVVVEGREVRFCCAPCAKKFDKAVAEKADKAIIEAQKAHYPLTTCPVSGQPLKDGGVEFVAGNRLVRTCCEKCAAGVKVDPKAAIEKLDAAVKTKDEAAYKLTTCPVSGEKLGKDAASVVVAGRLFKVCCPGCKSSLEKDPAGNIAKLDAKG